MIKKYDKTDPLSEKNKGKEEMMTIQKEKKNRKKKKEKNEKKTE